MPCYSNEWTELYHFLWPVKHLPFTHVSGSVSLPELQENCGCRDVGDRSSISTSNIICLWLVFGRIITVAENVLLIILLFGSLGKCKQAGGYMDFTLAGYIKEMAWQSYCYCSYRKRVHLAKMNFIYTWSVTTIMICWTAWACWAIQKMWFLMKLDV